VRRALEAEPTAVLAVDFLFWFAYGEKPESRRAEDLEGALKLLEKFDVPVVVGTLPNMKESVGKMLRFRGARTPRRADAPTARAAA